MEKKQQFSLLDVPGRTAREIDRAVRESIHGAFEKAVAILAQRRETLEQGARRLREKETLNEDDLKALGASAPPLHQAGAKQTRLKTGITESLK